jgi:hypothetical protein
MEKITTKNRDSATEQQNTLLRFTYRDNSADGKIIFQCDAKDILEADKLYIKKTGRDPAKQKYVGCSFKKITAEH